jgi:enamine deaminase RidA (YjgF/YER057c/UK114 family)
LRNVEAALETAGATPRDLVEVTVAAVDGYLLSESFAAFQEFWDPPVVNVLVVAGLAHPRSLVEISAIAVR